MKKREKIETGTWKIGDVMAGDTGNWEVTGFSKSWFEKIDDQDYCIYGKTVGEFCYAYLAKVA